MNEVIQILRDLVAFDTVSTESTTDANHYIRRFLEQAGYQCQTLGKGQFQSLICRNAVALEWSAARRKYLAFCAHIDTVPFDANLWTTDPFRLEERDGKLYGLGAADMKGPLACMLHTLREVARTAPFLPAALVVTHHEETALEGARELTQSATALAALQTMELVIGEPTSLALGYAHKGVYDFTITVAGRAAHSGNPHQGTNAIYGAARIASRISELNDQWRAAAKTHPDASNIVNVGTFHAGDVRNRVPDSAVLSGDMRIVPGSNPRVLTDVLENEFALLAGEGYECELTSDYEAKPFEMSRDEGMVRDLLAVLDVEPIRLGYATDAAVFQEAGIDCAILGPGDIRVCHMPNEFIERRQLELGVAMYNQMITVRNVVNFDPSVNTASRA